MSEIVTTTGRKMTQRLQDALDGCQNREVTIRALDASTGTLAPLHAALALELRLCQLREQDTLGAMSRDLTKDDKPRPAGLLRCVTWSFHTEDPADGRLLYDASPDLKSPALHGALLSEGPALPSAATRRTRGCRR